MSSFDDLKNRVKNLETIENGRKEDARDKRSNARKAVYAAWATIALNILSFVWMFIVNHFFGGVAK